MWPAAVNTMPMSGLYRVRRWRHAAQAKRWATMALLMVDRGFGTVAPPETMAVQAQRLQEHLSRRTAALRLAI